VLDKVSLHCDDITIRILRVSDAFQTELNPLWEHIFSCLVSHANHIPANYRNTLTLNMGIERTRMNEYRSGIALNTRLAQEAAQKETAAQQQAAQSYRATLQLNSRLATAAAQTEAQAEAEKARNYRATTALNLQLAGMRAAAERAGVVSAQSAAQQSATAFAAGAERTKQAIDSIRLSYARTRAQFDKDSGAAGNNWRAQRDAALAYQQVCD
jgi:hypothetical protein